jgi:NAD(P)H-dependent FMN reductase
MPRPVLEIIIASTRPGRVGLPVGTWVAEVARSQDRFDVEVVDLEALALPFLDEPGHPALGAYEYPHTRAWSETVDRADAFIFVMPEYNHGYTAPLKNALDFLHAEWSHKPVGLVSYGGVSGGLRAVQALKPVLAALRMMPLVEAVPVPNVAQFIDDDGRFSPTELHVLGAQAMVAELARTADALRPLRTRPAS